VRLLGSLLSGNVAGNRGGAIQVKRLSQFLMSNCTIASNFDGAAPAVTPAVLDQLTASTSPSDGGDFRLELSSALIDAGDNGFDLLDADLGGGGRGSLTGIWTARRRSTSALTNWVRSACRLK